MIANNDCVDINALALDFVARVLEAERRFVSAGWHDPVGLNDAGYRRNFRAGQFADPCLGVVYHYVSSCADTGVDPNARQCIRAGESWGIRLEADWLLQLINEIGFDQDEIDAYLVNVVRFTEIRERTAQRHLSEIGRLLIDTNRYEFLVRMKDAPGRLARPRRKQRRRRAHVG